MSDHHPPQSSQSFPLSHSGVCHAQYTIISHASKPNTSVLKSDLASSCSVQGLWCRHHLGVRGRNSCGGAGLQEHGSAPGNLPPLPPLLPQLPQIFQIFQRFQRSQLSQYPRISSIFFESAHLQRGGSCMHASCVAQLWMWQLEDIPERGQEAMQPRIQALKERIAPIREWVTIWKNPPL